MREDLWDIIGYQEEYRAYVVSLLYSLDRSTILILVNLRGVILIFIDRRLRLSSSRRVPSMEIVDLLVI